MTILDLEDKYNQLWNIYDKGKNESKIYSNFCDGLRQKVEFLERKNKQNDI